MELERTVWISRLGSCTSEVRAKFFGIYLGAGVWQVEPGEHKWKVYEESLTIGHLGDTLLSECR